MAHISVPTGCARVPVWSTRMLMRARRYIPLKKQHTLESAYTPKKPFVTKEWGKKFNYLKCLPKTQNVRARR
jgi:hypothetical protein